MVSTCLFSTHTSCNPPTAVVLNMKQSKRSQKCQQDSATSQTTLHSEAAEQNGSAWGGGSNWSSVEQLHLFPVGNIFQLLVLFALLQSKNHTKWKPLLHPEVKTKRGLNFSSESPLNQADKQSHQDLPGFNGIQRSLAQPRYTTMKVTSQVSGKTCHLKNCKLIENIVL